MSRNVQDLRNILFAQLDNLIDPAKDVDLERAGMVNDTANTIIHSAKAEIEYAKVIKGAVTIPFIESQDGCQERPYTPPTAPGEPAPLPPAETQKKLGFGHRSPAPDHHWRK